MFHPEMFLHSYREQMILPHSHTIFIGEPFCQEQFADDASVLVDDRLCGKAVSIRLREHQAVTIEGCCEGRNLAAWRQRRATTTTNTAALAVMMFKRSEKNLEEIDGTARKGKWQWSGGMVEFIPCRELLRNSLPVTMTCLRLSSDGYVAPPKTRQVLSDRNVTITETSHHRSIRIAPFFHMGAPAFPLCKTPICGAKENPPNA